MRWETGNEYSVQVRRDDGVANHIGPEELCRNLGDEVDQAAL